MSAPKFASLTPDLLARKGEAAPSIVAPPIVGFFPERPRVATAGALRMQRAGSLPTLVIGDAFPAMQTDDAEASIPQPPAKANTPVQEQASDTLSHSAEQATRPSSCRVSA